MGWVVNATPRHFRFTPGNDPVPIVQEADWAPGQVWTGTENLAPRRESIPGPSSPATPAHWFAVCCLKSDALEPVNISCDTEVGCYRPVIGLLYSANS
jgi:hypothetical protein